MSVDVGQTDVSPAVAEGQPGVVHPKEVEHRGPEIPDRALVLNRVVAILIGTDEYGYHAVEDKSTVWDLWATVLHLLGVDHTRLTFRYGGRDIRLTDVHGHVVNEILA